MNFYFILFKIEKKFRKGLFSSDLDYGFDDWYRSAGIDGWICRNDQDCNWIDDHLGCDDRLFSSTNLKVNFYTRTILLTRKGIKLQ